MSAEYTPPLLLDSGRVELDSTPDSDGDLELIATMEDMHVAYLRPSDQLAVRDLLNRLHPPKPRTVTTMEELDALPGGSVILDADGLAWQKYNRAIISRPGSWFSANSGDGFYFSRNFAEDQRTPAMVLHEGASK